MAEKINRVERDLKIEEQFEATLRGKGRNLEADRGYQRRKLKRLDKIALKYKGTTSPQEKESLLLLKGMRNKIQKANYNAVQIWFRKLFSPSKRRAAIKKDDEHYEQDLSKISGELIKRGFGGYEVDLRRLIRPDQRLTEINLSKHLGEGERAGYVIQIERDLDGRFHFEGFRATLDSRRLGINREQNFLKEDGRIYNADQAIQLLSGRSVEIGVQSLDGEHKKKWVGLDFNDRFANGNFRPVEVDGKDFNIEPKIRQLPLNMPPKRIAEVMQGLKAGRREEVTLTQNGKDETFYIEADPQKKTVNIYDAFHQKTTLISVMANVKAMEVGKENVLKQEDEHMATAEKKNVETVDAIKNSNRATNKLNGRRVKV